MTQSRKLLGQQGELAVIEWLRARHFSIRATNFRTRRGEVDIIAQRGELIVFVEVKTRLTSYFSLSQLITQSKQRKIYSAACTYIATHQLSDHILRFDVATSTLYNNEFAIDYIENAFTAPL